MKKVQYFLVVSKKCCTFAAAFEQWRDSSAG